MAIGFHGALFFTYAGNYFHGGTPLEWIALQSVAVLIVVLAVELLQTARMTEKIRIIIFAVAPFTSAIWALGESLRR